MRRNLGRLALFVVAVAIVGTLVASAVAGSSSRTTHARAAAQYRIGLVLPDLSNLYIAGHPRRRAGAGQEEQRHDPREGHERRRGAGERAAVATSAPRSTRSSSTRSTATRSCPPIKAANAAGIPVVAIQSNVYGGKVATFISGREDHAGQAMGQNAVDWCKNINPCKIGDRRGDPRRPVGRGGEQGVPRDRRAAQEHPDRRRRRDAVRPGEGPPGRDRPADGASGPQLPLRVVGSGRSRLGEGDPGRGQARQDRRRLAERRLHRARPRPQGRRDRSRPRSSRPIIGGTGVTSAIKAIQGTVAAEVHRGPGARREHGRSRTRGCRGKSSPPADAEGRHHASGSSKRSRGIAPTK